MKKKKRIIIGYSSVPPANSICTAIQKELILNEIKVAITSHTDIEVVKLAGDHEIMWVRDLFFILEGKCVLCNCTKNDSIMKDRSKEILEILPLINSSGYPILQIPESAKLEGGDVIQNGFDLFIGLNERSNYEAVKFLSANFPAVNIISIRHNDMHLDCVMTVVGKTIFYSRRRIEESDLFHAAAEYNLVNIDDDTDGVLSTNLLVIGNHIFHTDRIQNKPIINHLMGMGYNVHTIKYGNLWREGGGIRCLTQEL